MPPVEVRPFRRGDRDQLTNLVNAHAEAGARLPRHGGWADVGNLWVAEAYRRRGVATWLLGQTADWLDLGQVARLLDYASLEESADASHRSFLAAAGFRELTRTQRGWTRDDLCEPPVHGVRLTDARRA
jgi:GNAT superfamily N-acetyltransferase